MPDSFDVVVVGSRCAGAPLAMLLARSGLSVGLIDRARFPSEVPSTHAIQPNGVAALERFGLADRVRAAGAAAIVQAKIEIDGVVVDYTSGNGFAEATGSPMICMRRSVLDPLLIEGAVEAGVDFRPGTAATGLLETDGRVTGVQTATGPLTARLVVGADGPHSGVARMAGSQEYHVSPPGRMFIWGYYGGTSSPPPRIWLGKRGDIGLLAAPTDSDLFLVAVTPSQDDKARVLADTAGALARGWAEFPELADLVSGARLAGPVRTMSRWHGYFRQAWGPGWVLAGDAGHFKDPTPGQGIADAFRQVERLAPAVTAGLRDGSLDDRLRAWARWRDRDAWEMYWFSTDMGAAGPTSPLMREMVRRLVAEPGGADRFLRVLDHDLPPSKVFTGPRAIAATLGLMRSGPVGRRAVAGELRQVVGREISRMGMRRRPRYEPCSSPGVAAIDPGGVVAAEA